MFFSEKRENLVEKKVIRIRIQTKPIKDRIRGLC
jgi:hypothetical protein